MKTKRFASLKNIACFNAIFIALLLCGIAAKSSRAQNLKAVHFYVASEGNDENAGTSPQTAWKTLAKVSRTVFAPGDVISFKRGGIWKERLEIRSKGTAKNPIRFTSYGKGAKPVIDGDGVTVPEFQALVMLLGAGHTRLENLEVRNSQRDGIGAYDWKTLTIADCLTHHNQFCGISVYQGENITISGCEIRENSLDAGKTGAYAGLRLNGTIKGAQILKNEVHHNLGGPKGWADVANGIYLGQDNFPSLSGIVITGNKIHDNGNDAQNQAGRGINASMRGDLEIRDNTILDQSASGVFVSVPKDGEASKVVVRHNLFLRNHLRAMGALGNLSVEFSNNVVYAANAKLPDHSYTGLAILDKTTRWNVRNNIFHLDSTNATWRGFIVIADDMGAQAEFDHNLYYTSGENKWMSRTEAGKTGIHAAENYPPLTRAQWLEKGYDAHSVFNKAPLFAAPDKEDFHLQKDSPAIDAGTDVKLVTDAEDKKVPQGAAPDIGLYEYIKK